ncbi:MAG: phage tail tape measure protein, partial [Candidatus Marinimicrobia bacterium]|nr:phage tail tape measure protein [Candidatus Neomarinimicrobiota bacterium]
KTVPDNAQKLTKALYQIVSAGYDGAEAMKILRTSTELAVASVTDTFTAADTLTYVMNAYGKAAGTAAEISDKLFTIIKLGKVKMEELGPTISMVTGLAAQAGLSFNELAAMYAEAVKKMSPHIVSTGIRGIITAMLRVSKGEGEAADKARELGIEFDIAALKSKGFKQILSDIIEKTKGNEAALMSLFPNVRGLIGLLAIMTDEGEGFNKTLAEIENSLGATDKAFKTMVDTTENQLAILRNNVMAKLKPLGDSLLKQMNNIASGINIAMSGANDELSKLARSYSELTDTLQRKQGRIDDLIKTVEDLRSKTELTKTETIELEAAERALGVYFPILGKAAEDAADSIDVLTLAKEGTIDLSIRIMELGLEQAKIEMRRADLNKELYDRNEDEGNKEIRRIKKQIKAEEELTEFILTGGEKGLFKQEQLNDMMEIRLKDNVEYLKLTNELSIATEKMALEEDQLILNQEKSRIEVDALTESLENLKKTREKPVIIPKTETGEPPKEPAIIPALTDEQIEEAKDKLKYMANQYKKYLADVAQFGKEYVEEHNALLTEEGKSYAQFLSNMAADYEGNADLTRQITDDIYEYNKGLVAKRKEIEKELFDYLVEERGKAIQAEKDKFEAIIKNYEEGSDEYINAVDQHKKNELAINEEYDEKMAEAKLAIFKEGLEQQLGEEKEAYKIRLEMAKAELGEKIKANEKYFEFIE